MIENLILALVCLLPFGHLLFKQLDLWHGQGQFFQAGLLIIFSLSFFVKPKQINTINKPLGAFILWAGLSTSCVWIKTLTATQNYAIKIFLPFFNLLCLVLFYKLCLEYLNSKSIDKILKWFRYSVILILFYCVLQYLQLDEFLKGMDNSGRDELVGTIGNASHLAGYLAIVSPLFFNKKGILPLILLLIILLLAGSASGLFVAVVVGIVYLLLKKRYLWSGIISFLACSGGTILLFDKSGFFTSNHRIELWKMAFEGFRQKAITGFGLGSFALNKFETGGIVSVWRHAHNEYFQIAFELGLIGLFLLLWVVYSAIKDGWLIHSKENGILLFTMLIGFLALSLFTFTMHLWQISVLGMFIYSAIYVIKNNSGIQALGV